MANSRATSRASLPVERKRLNFIIEGRRTTVNLEAAVWEGLVSICRLEELSLDDLCESIAERRGPVSISSALRVAVLIYFRHMVERERANGGSPLTAALDRIGTAPTGRRRRIG